MKNLNDLVKNQRKLAKEVGVTESYISHIVAGRRTPSLRVAERISKVLGCSVDEFIMEIERIQKKEIKNNT